MSVQATFIPERSALFLWTHPTRSDSSTTASSWSAVERAVWPELNRLLEPGSIELSLPERDRTTVDGAVLALPAGLPGLFAFEQWGHSTVQYQPSVSLRIWSLAARLGLELLARQRALPVLGPDGMARWRVTLLVPKDQERFAKLVTALPPAARAASPETPPAEILRHFLDALADKMARSGEPYCGSSRRLRTAWEEPFFHALNTTSGIADLPPPLLDAASRSLQRWARRALELPKPGSWRLCLKLTPPAAGDTWEILYYLQNISDPSLFLPFADYWSIISGDASSTHTASLPLAATVIAQLRRLACALGPIQESLQTPRPDRARLEAHTVWQFLSSVMSALEESEVSLVVPEELSATGQQRLRTRIRLGDSERKDQQRVEGRLPLSQAVKFSYEMSLGDQTLTDEEFREIVALKRPLVRWRNQWIIVDPQEIQRLAALAQGAASGEIPTGEAMRGALEGQMRKDRVTLPVALEGQLAAVVQQIKQAGGIAARSAPPGFRGELRPYQARGYAWLEVLTRLGLGALLADDMGLGKTIQVIALMLERRTHSAAHTLLVCPASVLGNWEREISRFGPELSVHRHHGSDRVQSLEELRKRTQPPGIIVTTYSTLRQDQDLFSRLPLDLFILDEAQNIKNPDAQQSCAARSIRARGRIALTGTPVENCLTDLWSLMDILNPGLLETLPRFRNDLAFPIERFADEQALRTLHRLTAPFILRRLKTDPGIVADLPAKNEMLALCSLSAEQASLYQAAIDEGLETIRNSEGIARRGRILTLLLHLKQILNHPAQFLRQKDPLAGRSGKLSRLEEMLEEVVAAGDRALIFTQFVQMGELLVRRLGQVLRIEVPFLHGGLPPRARDEQVRCFQEEADVSPLLIVSLKAGGTGLNLTRASHVFHFDRWWNPAVEDQATDRAYRIGQTRSVQIHKLVTMGTLEEKLDLLIEQKRALARRAVSSGEAFLTELSDDELSRLVALDHAVVEEMPSGGEERAAGVTSLTV